jgi:hypothetical protein
MVELRGRGKCSIRPSMMVVHRVEMSPVMMMMMMMTMMMMMLTTLLLLPTTKQQQLKEPPHLAFASTPSPHEFPNRIPLVLLVSHQHQQPLDVQAHGTWRETRR